MWHRSGLHGLVRSGSRALNPRMSKYDLSEMLEVRRFVFPDPEKQKTLEGEGGHA